MTGFLCENCIHWNDLGMNETLGRPDGWGQCRINPPVVTDPGSIIVGDLQGRGEWPITWRVDCCSKFRLKLNLDELKRELQRLKDGFRDE